MASSEERRDALTGDVVAVDYKLNERLGELEEYEALEPGALTYWGREYRRIEKALLDSLGAKETAEYLKAKSQLMYEHAKHIN